MSENPTENGSQHARKQSEHISHALRQLQESSAFKFPATSTPTPTVTATQHSQEQPQLASVPAPEPTPSPQSEWARLHAQLHEKPVDADGWSTLVDLAQASGDIEKIKVTYNGILEMYPNNPSVQIAYVKHFLDDSSQFRYAEKLFEKFLPKTTGRPSVDVLKVYLAYIRRIATGPKARDIIRKCYDFALAPGRAGQDSDSHEVWQDYIKFLKAGETSTSREEQAKMDAVRDAYQKAVQIPMENVRKLWEDYQDFEKNLNKVTARKFISDLQENHMQARTVLSQLKEHQSKLFPPLSAGEGQRSSIWLPRPPTFDDSDKLLAARWRHYLKWEEGNPLGSDEKTYATRVLRAYAKATVHMQFYPEIWYMAYVWSKKVGNTEDAQTFLGTGIETNPASFVLNFAYAEVLELQGKDSFDDVRVTYDNFLQTLREGLEVLESRLSSTTSANGSKEHGQTQGSSAPDVAASQPSLMSNRSSFNAQEKPPKDKNLSSKRRDYGTVWIAYIRFARRAQGLQSARSLFSKARRDRWTPWEVYEAEALMEYHGGDKDITIASRIFEKAMERFSDDVEFVLCYLRFLISVNDEKNARALFERVKDTFPPDEARPLWERWAKYEYQYGDLAAARKFEERMAEVYPRDSRIKRFAERYKYGNIDSIARRDLGFMLTSTSGSTAGAPTNNSSGHLGRTSTVQSIASASYTAAKSSGRSLKRSPSPDHQRRGDNYSSKRARPRSASRGRDRDRDRRDGPPYKRYVSPASERERRDPRRSKEERQEHKEAQLPNVLARFLSALPSPHCFDGPVFRTDDLMRAIMDAVIPRR